MTSNEISNETGNPLPVGNSGIYIDPEQTIQRLDDWMQNTSADIRMKQVENVLFAGAALCVVGLLVLALTRAEA